MKQSSTERLRELEELVDSCREPLFRFAFFRLGSRMVAEVKWPPDPNVPSATRVPTSSEW